MTSSMFSIDINVCVCVCVCVFQCVQRGLSVLPVSDVREPQRGLDQPAAPLPHQGDEDQRRQGEEEHTETTSFTTSSDIQK